MLAAAAALLFGARSFVPPTVTVVGLGRQDIEGSLVLVGRVRSRSVARLGASAAGTVAEVLVREGETVAGGQVLVTLDDREARAGGRTQGALA